jgi:hypothetical protein
MAKFPMVFRPWKRSFWLEGDDNDKIIPLIYKALEKSTQKKVQKLEKRISDKYSFDL